MLEQYKIEKTRNKALPIYEQISSHLTSQIEKDLSAGDRLPSMSQMAKHWDVGFNTIKAAIRELEQKGLVRRGSKRGEGPLVLGKEDGQFSNATFCHFRSYNDAFELQIASGVRHFADEVNADSVVIDINESVDYLLSILEITRPHNIIVKPIDSVKFREKIQILQQSTNVVFVDGYLPDVEISSVSVDHLDGAYQATKHLLQENNLPVYYFGHLNPNDTVIQLRIEGWATAMREYGYLDVSEFMYKIPLMQGNTSHESYADVFRKASFDFLTSIDFKPISLFTHNDYAAQAIINNAEKLGLEIRQDIKLAGFGNLPLCNNLPVKLTSVDQSNEQVGYEAAKLLYYQNNTRNQALHIKMPAKLVVRESSL